MVPTLKHFQNIVENFHSSPFSDIYIFSFFLFLNYYLRIHIFNMENKLKKKNLNLLHTTIYFFDSGDPKAKQQWQRSNQILVCLYFLVGLSLALIEMLVKIDWLISGSVLVWFDFVFWSVESNGRGCLIGLMLFTKSECVSWEGNSTMSDQRWRVQN